MQALPESFQFLPGYFLNLQSNLQTADQPNQPSFPHTFSNLPTQPLPALPARHRLVPLPRDGVLPRRLPGQPSHGDGPPTGMVPPLSGSEGFPGWARTGGRGVCQSSEAVVFFLSSGRWCSSWLAPRLLWVSVLGMDLRRFPLTRGLARSLQGGPVISGRSA